MPGNDYFTPVEQPNVMAQMAQILQLQGAMQDRRKEAQLSQFLQQGDVNSVEGLRQAYQIDPEFGMKLSRMQGQQGESKNRMSRVAAQTEQEQVETAMKKQQLLSGIAGMTVNQFRSLPPERQTPEIYARTYQNGRAAALQTGMFASEEIPEFMPLEQLEITVGGGFSPAQQATDERGRMTIAQTGENQEAMMGLRERQFSQQSGIEQQRLEQQTAAQNAQLGMRKQGIENTEAFRAASLAQRASNTLAAGSGSGGGATRKASSGGGGKAPSGYRWTESGDLEPIPGGPRIKALGEAKPSKPETIANAGKISMVEQAEQDVKEARNLMFSGLDKDGKLTKESELNRGTLAGTMVPGSSGITEKSRLLISKIENAISAKYRLETGAAGNAEEVRSIARRFMPTPMDTVKSAADKLDRLEGFMRGTLDVRKGATAGPAAPRTGTAPNLSEQGLAAEMPAGAMSPRQRLEEEARRRGLMQ